MIFEMVLNTSRVGELAGEYSIRVSKYLTFTNTPIFVEDIFHL